MIREKEPESQISFKPKKRESRIGSVINSRSFPLDMNRHVVIVERQEGMP
jgi:hypothetical protein